MARAKKKAPSADQEHAIALNKKQLSDLLSMREEDQMIDDHGKAVLGRRDHKPGLPEEAP